MSKYTKQNKQSLENNKKALVDYVISQLESGTSWQKCWEGAGGLPYSASTGNRYKGGNCFYLAYTAIINGYTSSEWGTFKAWKDQGGNVMKGQKGTKIIFYKPVFKENEQGETEVFFTVRAYTVFNRCQVANLPEQQSEEYKAKCEGNLFDYCTNEGIEIVNTGRACYNAKDDMITLPSAYNCEARGWSTVAHEIVHSTGHKSRLSREGVTNFDSFGSHQYSYEELVAELGSMFICNDLGLATDDSNEQSAAYCKSWIKVLKNNPDWLWKAASEAQKACDFVIEKAKIEKIIQVA